jgi:hypothetical protein
VTTQELVRNIFRKLNRLKIVIFIGGVIFAVLLFMYAKSIPAVYSVKSTVYPLTAGPDDKSASSKISELLGGSSNSKTLSDEANVNIEEVGRSRRTREAVASERIPIFGNKTIAQILIEDYNKTKPFYKPALKMPTTDPELIASGASILKDYYTVKFNKNSLLEMTFSSSNDKLITPTSLILIDKISQFYKELKIKKAQFDFDFTQKKVDSLEGVLRKFDNQRIQLNNTTLFVQPGKLQYTVPKENLENNKLLVLAQRNGAASNREEALWRKQKVTPIIEILDRPEPPFDVSKPSKVIYAGLGFVLGCIIFSLLLISGILYRYLNNTVQNKLAVTLYDSTVTTSA